MSHEAPSAPGRSRALDGLRGLAILLVLAYHLPVVTLPDGHDHALPGGWLGVDLFFVLSGYLITAHMLREHTRTGTIDRPAFYRRRWRRLGPALIAVLVVWTVLVLAGVMPVPVPPATSAAVTVDAVVSPWLAAATLSSNWWILLGPGLPVSMAHLWSLAIEEQFYLVWPTVLLGLLRTGSRRGWSASRSVLVVAIPVALVCLVAIPVVADTGWLLGDQSARQVLYFASWTRVPALLGGASVAAVVTTGRRPGPRASAWLGRAALAAWGLFAVLWVMANDTMIDSISLALPLAAVLGTLVLAQTVLVPSRDPARGFGRRPLVWLGRRSYALYLWNWPWTVVATHQLPGLSPWAQGAIAVGLTLVSAELSWRLVERRFQRSSTAPVPEAAPPVSSSLAREQ